ncbi:sigma-54 dependent transcriptional regulator [Allohahella marinimesophila]|uniref:Sigma-54 dependent transcriptional regulator n=1 Tax=Allohahella marinimesophila TaxID=1054972 RepID=A0ABP7PTB8_9GAMM
MKGRILVVDDEPDIRALLEITLSRMGLETRAAANLHDARQFLAEETFDTCLTDMNLPDGSGLDLVEHITGSYPKLPVAVITAYGSVDTAILALKAGAFDFVSKPVELSRLRTLVEQALTLNSDQKKDSPRGSGILGESSDILRLNAQIQKLARSQAPVYISGESGSGKELVARALHNLGPRADGPFVPVNCGAIPPDLMEGEFFGHRKGAFTGAMDSKEGLFQAAHGGTLFLDEVADLPLSMQVKLLRAIQEKAIRKIGEQTEIPVDIRILSATHKALHIEVERGRFRQDLYYRINVIELHVPPLRQRKSDIPLLANALLNKISALHGSKAPKISSNALEKLCAYSYPGNVRELENLLERAATLCEGNVINANDIHFNHAVDATVAESPQTPREEALQAEKPVEVSVSSDSIGRAAAGRPVPDIDATDNLEAYLEQLERREIEKALEANRWNKTAAAKQLGISFRALRYRLKKLNLE